MTKVEFKKPSGPLSEYTERQEKTRSSWLSTGNHLPRLSPFETPDEETVALSSNRKFLKIIDRSRARAKREGGISAREVRRRLGLTK